MHILEFGQEILCEIFQHSSNLLQCALVCKAWHVAALQLFYREVTLNQCRFLQTKKQLKLDPGERDGYFKYGSSVKRLKIRIIEDDDNNESEVYDDDKTIPIQLDFDKDEFLSLLECLPNVETLELGENSRSTKYFQFITDTKSTVCLKYIRAVWPLQTTGLLNESYPDNFEFRLGYKCRETITNTSLKYDSIMMDIGSRHDKTLNFLAQLTKLTYLSLLNTCDDNLTTLDLQRICPNLTTIKYMSNKLIPDATVKMILEDPFSPVWCSKLKSLTITVPTIPVNYVKCLIQLLSTHVQHFHVYLTQVYMFDWIEEIGLDNALDLARMISTVEDTTFETRLEQGFQRKASHYSSRMTTFFMFLHALIGDKQLYCRFEFVDLEDELANNFTVAQSEEGVLYVSYPLSSDEYRFADVLDASTFEVDLPDYVQSTMGLDIVQEMFITTNDSSHLKTVGFINFAVTHCPNLLALEYECMGDPWRKHCFSNAINPSAGINEELSAFSESPRCRMKTFITRDFYAVGRSFFAKYFPCIESLVCDFEYLSPAPSAIDITRFRSLKTFYFALDLLSDIDERHLVIQFEFSDGDTMCYTLDMTNPFADDSFKWDVLQKGESCQHNISIRCHKHVKIIAKSYRYGIVAEFLNGKLLDYVSIDSNFFPEEYGENIMESIEQ